MGTHPIFESDFDCLTVLIPRVIFVLGSDKMSFREHIGDEEVELANSKSGICSSDLISCSVWKYVQLVQKSAKLIQIWERRIKSCVGGELIKMHEHFHNLGKKIGEHLMVDFILSACINKKGRCSLCRQKESNLSKYRRGSSYCNARLDHTAQCQSWALSIVGCRSKYGHVLRSVSPRVKPKSYRISQNRKKSKAKKHSQAPIHARVTRQYKINHRG